MVSTHAVSDVLMIFYMPTINMSEYKPKYSILLDAVEYDSYPNIDDETREYFISRRNAVIQKYCNMHRIGNYNDSDVIASVLEPLVTKELRGVEKAYMMSEEQRKQFRDANLWMYEDYERSEDFNVYFNLYALHRIEDEQEQYENMY